MGGEECVQRETFTQKTGGRLSVESETEKRLKTLTQVHLILDESGNMKRGMFRDTETGPLTKNRRVFRDTETGPLTGAG